MSANKPNNDQDKISFEALETDINNETLEPSIFQRLQAKTAATLVGSAIMLPILAVGTSTYYFGSQAVNKQIILAKTNRQYRFG